MSDLAEYIANDRLGSIPNLFLTWQNKRLNRSSNTNAAVTIMNALFRECVGNPTYSIQESQLEGSIAFYLWRALNISKFGATITHLDPPTFSPLDGGADCFEIHTEYANYCFRIWESKKEQSGNNTKSTTKKACDQIERRAESYLARIVYDSRFELDPNVKAVKQNCFERWIIKASDSGVGIAITSEPHGCTENALSDVNAFIGPMTSPQVKSMAIGIPGFKQFCLDVQGEIWKGI